jgi:hypothetical protein
MRERGHDGNKIARKPKFLLYVEILSEESTYTFQEVLLPRYLRQTLNAMNAELQPKLGENITCN